MQEILQIPFLILFILSFLLFVTYLSLYIKTNRKSKILKGKYNILDKAFVKKSKGYDNLTGYKNNLEKKINNHEREIKDINTEKNKYIDSLESILKEKTTELKNERSVASKNKKYFYAYDRARNLYFGKNPSGNVFYKHYLDSKKLPMNKLNEDFNKNRKNAKNIKKVCKK